LEQVINSIPRPIVRTNQWFIVLSVLVTWLSGQVWVLALPLLAGLLGLFVNFNPVMRFAKLFLKKKPSEYIPEDLDQQQFNQIIAVLCLALAISSYVGGWMILFYIFTTLVALAAFIAILGFCIGCFIRYQWIQFQQKRKIRKQG
jgi:MFS family permease